jgi:beta-carotene 15,15'-dioxygenase
VIQFDMGRKYLLGIGLLLVLGTEILTIAEEYQLYFLVIIVTLTGVPHGSLDFFIEKQSYIKNNQKITLKSFLIKYLLSMLYYGLAWWLFPSVSLLAFIVMAAYHFGEIDWPVRANNNLEVSLYTIYGFLLIVFILTSHINSAAPILEAIVQRKVSAEFWFEVGTLLFPYSCILFGLHLTGIVFLHTNLGWDNKILYQFLIQTLILVSVLYWLPLYLSFGFYFGLWHSLISFNLIRQQMNLSNDWPGWFFMVKKAIPFTTIAWLGIGVLIFASGIFSAEWLVLSNLFMAIAILTLPHLQVFTKIKFG